MRKQAKAHFRLPILMTDDSQLTQWLGSTTEARIAEAYSQACVLTAVEAAGLIGIDEKSLRALAGSGHLLSVPRGGGRSRGFPELAIRTFLAGTDDLDQGSAHITTRQRAVGTTRQPIVGFTERRKTKRAALAAAKMPR